MGVLTVVAAFSPSLLAQDAVQGLFLGAVFALLGIGVVLIYKSSGVLNFAHGSMAMFSTYAYWQIDRSLGLPVAVSVVLTVGVGALLGAGAYAVVFRRMREAGLLAKVIAALAVAGFLQGAAAFLWGGGQARVPQQFPEGALRIGSVAMSWQQIGTVAVTLLVSVGVIQLLKRTTFGVALRATAQNRAAAKMLGVQENRVAATAWALGGALAALAGALVIPLSALTVYSMLGYMVRGFVAAVVGGFVSLPASVIGGFGLGVVQESLLAVPPLAALSRVFAGLAIATLLLLRVERHFALEQELRALEDAG
ncbi:MAG: branched-chain amino acid ABC transporter permease [Acidobacteria bacterium]|nr:branched-chain amino acid ABC transporter permease [Acidobacteriota bacterium]